MATTEEIKLTDLQFQRQIGRGSFGVVHYGTYFGTDVAIKTLTTTDPDLQKYVQRELELLQRLRHPGITQFIGICTEESEKIHIVMEYISRGNLCDLIENGEPLSWKMRLKFAVESASAMAYLHSKKVIHRDLKTENLLIDDNFTCKVCDFGLARVNDKIQQGSYMTIVGTDDFMAPEVMLGMEYDEKADTFSWGVVLCHIITRMDISTQFPRTVKDCFSFPSKTFIRKVPKECPSELSALVIECVQDDQTKRPSFVEIIERLKKVQENLPEEAEEIKKKEQDEKRDAVTGRESEFVEENKGLELKKREQRVRKLSMPDENSLKPFESHVTPEIIVHGETVHYEFLNVPMTFPDPTDDSIANCFRLVVTSYRVMHLFTNPDTKEKKVLVSIPLNSLWKIEKFKFDLDRVDLYIYCYTFQKYAFRFPAKKFKSVLSGLNTICIQGRHRKNLFAMVYHSSQKWSPIDYESEFKRMGAPSGFWKLVTGNKDFKISSVYPPVMYTPPSFDDEKFKPGRHPLLCWKRADGSASLLRAVRTKKITVEALANIVYQTNPKKMVYFFHLDSKKDGYIGERFEVFSLHVEGLQSVKHAYSHLLLQSVSEDEDKWISSFESSKHMLHVKQLIQVANRLVSAIEKGNSVVVRSKDADRCTEFLSLAQILLDPYYRTFEGFRVLIEKEWCSFGYKFFEKFVEKKDYAPLFLEFLDSVWQCILQFPDSFQFNEKFLVFLMDELLGGLYGDFLMNNLKERAANKLTTSSASVWSAVEQNKQSLKNPNFKEENTTLHPVSSLKTIRFWFGYYVRQQPKPVKVSF